MSETRGILIDVDGTIHTRVVRDYRAIQAAVGGCFDVVTSSSGQTSFWLNDEGKLIGLPINTIATAALWRLNEAFVNRDVLVGPVFITGGVDENGETLSINDEGLQVLAQITTAVRV